MNAYKIRTQYNSLQNDIVIADTMSYAERLYEEKYPDTKILSIELISEYVIVQEGGEVGQVMTKMLQHDWKMEYRYADDFQTALMRAVECADHINLAKLEKEYPDIIASYRKWQEGDAQ